MGDDFTSGWVEPTEEQRTTARFLRGWYLAFQEAGFTAAEAMGVIAAAMKAGTE